MKERPILFSAPMVRAILDGSKTQTRRVVKPAPKLSGGTWYFHKRGCPVLLPNGSVAVDGCPYGQPGDRLWVREAWSLEMIGAFGTAHGYDSTYELRFRADDVAREIHVAPGESDPYIKLYDSQRGDWRPSIHMPRWASRILLEIVSVRVERLNEISAADSYWEGIDQCLGLGSRAEIIDLARRMGTFTDETLRYATLWESINGAGSWDANPWVWVVEFKRVTP